MVERLGEVVLALEDVAVMREERGILRAVSFDCRVGEMLVLVGANGAGKTTLLRSILGLTQKSGVVRIGGVACATVSRREYARQLAYLPQHVDIPTELTAGEFIEMGRHPWRRHFARLNECDRRAIARAIEQTQTASFLNQALETLSGGERQRVYLAAALAQEARILLLDEPTTGLDPVQGAEVWRLLATLCRANELTVVVATHDIEAVRPFADRFLALRRGEVFFDGPPLQFFAGSVREMTYRMAGDAPLCGPVGAPRV